MYLFMRNQLKEAVCTKMEIKRRRMNIIIWPNLLGPKGRDFRVRNLPLTFDCHNSHFYPPLFLKLKKALFFLE